MRCPPALRLPGLAGLGPRLGLDAPRLDRCQPSCARTDRHAAGLVAKAEALEKQSVSEALPGPLAERLARRAGQLREMAEGHEYDRTDHEEPTP
ncbi:hypothetical protein [Streptomyces sp. SCL15-4]|uniref:hypothetical protein n=1 Tax=Streptomyces sp. SCL15-4 TaxID=2967221 RepID=UPI002966C0A6|nr:hypothetical protein [Streptomyces sp. SCL15-4]